MIKTLKLFTTRDQVGKRLDEVLAGWLPAALGRPVSKAKLRKLIMSGSVFLNGRPVRIPSKVLHAGTTLEAHIDMAKLFADSTRGDRKFELTPDRILFEDENLIIVDKPPGLPSHPTVDEARDNLFAAVQRFLSKRDGIAKPYLGIHQRLDRDTSGIVLFTKSERVNAAVAEIFSSHQGVKIYQAITASRSGHKFEKEWVVKNHLGKISSKSKRARYGAVKSGGNFAETSFRVLGNNARGVWVEANPKTGRTHQIRVHLSEYGLPILGDDLYGLAEVAPRLMLHAARLTFTHPITKREISINAPLPADFQERLRILRFEE